MNIFMDMKKEPAYNSLHNSVLITAKKLFLIFFKNIF